MSNSIYLRLAGPLQSWARKSVSGHFVRTEPVPTRSGLEGLIAGALGAHRGWWPKWLATLDFSIRVDCGGILTDEFQTINERDDEEEFRRRLLIMLGHDPGRPHGSALAFTPMAPNKKKGQKPNRTAIVRRTYLADAEFIVRITSEEHGEEIAEALRKPAFSTYLGRKAFAAEFPFFLGVGPAAVWENLPVVTEPDRHGRSMGGQACHSWSTDAESGGVEDKGALTGSRVPLKVIEYSPGLPASNRLQQFPQVSSWEEWLQYVGETLERSIAVL